MSELSPEDTSYIQELYARKIQNQRIVRHIMQSIIAESPYKADMEWEVWHRAHEIEEQNGYPEGVTAWDVHQEYLRTWEAE